MSLWRKETEAGGGQAWKGRTRAYLPYGTEWYLYLCRRLAEHPPNILRAVCDAVAGSYP